MDAQTRFSHFLGELSDWTAAPAPRPNPVRLETCGEVSKVRKNDLVTNIRGRLQKEVDQRSRERGEDLGQAAVVIMEDDSEGEDDLELLHVGASGRY